MITFSDDQIATADDDSDSGGGPTLPAPLVPAATEVVVVAPQEKYRQNNDGYVWRVDPDKPVTHGETPFTFDRPLGHKAIKSPAERARYFAFRGEELTPQLDDEKCVITGEKTALN